MLQAILVAEDDANFRDVVAWSLRAEGYRVVTAADGLEALGHLTDGQVGLAILDARMPTMNGLEVIARMRASATLRRVPIVVLTGFPADVPSELTILPKPFSAESLLDTVRAIL